ncbi:MAG: winged helix-turn-helix transcriptional regulator [Alphaproteobacteria bacterium]|nr:winged helix-turn-helix transcriptional regulator [Alphaproteobacteria bacterium]
MQDIMTIANTNSALALAHLQSRRILLELAFRECSLQELARATGLSLSLLNYHVSRLRSLQLVEIACIEKRAGRPVKRYRAKARAFFVPAALGRDGRSEALARELNTALERSRAGHAGSGTVYSVDAAGVQRMRRVSRRSSAWAFEVWIRLSLGPRNAARLRRELEALLRSYENIRPSAGQREVLVHCGFAEPGR